MILSFIACTISYYLIIFGLPVFLIGATIVLFSKAKLKTKTITVILPIILWLPASYTFLYFYNLTTPETYLIPWNVRRKRFRVIYGEKCGVEPRNEKGRRIIEIPDNGILIIKPNFESGWIDHEYYFVDTKGNKTKVGNENFVRDKTNRETSVFVSVAGAGVMSGTSPDKSSDIHFSDFEIYNQDTVVYNFKESEKLDLLTRALVDKCRAQ